MTSTTISQPGYLIAYGTAGLMGRFVSENAQATYQRGNLVRLRTERGCEHGTVLTQTDWEMPIDAMSQPGIILGLASAAQTGEGNYHAQAQQCLDQAQQLAREFKLSAHLIDVELIEDPATAVCHVLRYDPNDLSPWLAALSERWQRRVILHDVTNPASWEQPDTGCSSCGSRSGCGSGGCSSGGCCSSDKSPSDFHRDWQKYFAELRMKMLHGSGKAERT